MTQPQPEGALFSACLTRRRDRRSETGHHPTPPIDSLSGYSCCHRCLSHCAAFTQLAQDHSASPIEVVHGRILPQTRMEVYRARLGAGWVSSWGPKITFRLLSVFGCVFGCFFALLNFSLTTQIRWNPFILSVLSSCPRRESNTDLQFRKPSFYPLNYGGAC